jgi:tetratricopeptide (TPR) repeat protein
MRRVAWIAVALLLGAWDPITRKQSDVAQGNAQLKAGKAADAEASYQKALAALPQHPGVLYDLGAAHYLAAQALPAGDENKKKLLESAEKELRLAGDAPETTLRAASHYNLGNTLFAEEKWKDAIEEYKKTLRLDPQHEAARHNLELALTRVPPPPPPQQQPQQGQKNDDQKKPSDAQQQPQQQPQPQQGQKNDDQKDQGQGAQQKDQPPPAPNPPPKPDDGQGQTQDDPGKGEPKPQQGKPPDGPKKDGEAKPASAKEGEPPADKDMDRKLDLLEDRSKDLQVQKTQEHARERRRNRPVKDW